MMGDRGVHTIDAIVSSLKLGHPESIECTKSKVGLKMSTPKALSLNFDFLKERDSLHLNLPGVKAQSPLDQKN